MCVFELFVVFVVGSESKMDDGLDGFGIYLF